MAYRSGGQRCCGGIWAVSPFSIFVTSQKFFTYVPAIVRGALAQNWLRGATCDALSVACGIAKPRVVNWARNSIDTPRVRILPTA